jgi:uncharacterized protein (DUF2384 family)
MAKALKHDAQPPVSPHKVGPRVVASVSKHYARVLAHAVDTFGSQTRANDWLNRPNTLFNGRSPIQVLTEDPAGVEEELVRIDHGMVV